MKSMEQIHAELIEKSVDDSNFRDQLVADPKGVISQEFGFEFPDDISIEIHQNSFHKVHIALPPVAAELTEEQLEAVAAGSCCGCAS